MQNSKADFIRVYANLPIGLRSDIIIVTENEGPITWNAAYVEVENDTDLGKEILARLSDMEII